MLKAPVSAGSYPAKTGHGTPPLAGVVIGAAISLLLWAMILIVFFAVR
jgi:uncharacterized membrane protein